MKLCVTDYNYLASPDFNTLSLHLVTCISLPLHSVGFYCILYKTPPRMNSMKWLLINLHFWCFLFDIILSIFAIPYPLFPAMAGYGLGIIDSPGLLFYLIVTVITATSTSVYAILENRFYVMFAENSRWKYVRKWVLAGSYTMVPIYFLPSQFFIPEQEEARIKVWESLECQPEIPDHRELFVLSVDMIIPGYSIMIAETVPSVQVATLFVLSVYNLVFSKSTVNLSERTVKLQRQLALAIFIQVGDVTNKTRKSFLFQCFFILVLMAIPINVVVYSVKFEYQSQVINNLMFFCFSLHGTASTLIMMFIHRPYRDFILTPFRKLQHDASTFWVSSHRFSGGSVLERI
ncbi:CRE-SRH-250 protein [Caenorhabditis remanei]|uniref:CRE-SRH-250 protein n=1 Tax=Caenorhabditis remanei TaxID=31234 RepID=E3LHR3_CAERE|nr:CRE-SRH-250 protein [Caenorhabditis remanei]